MDEAHTTSATGFDPGGISFERLKVSDLPLMHRWLNTPHVARWYGEGSTHRGIEEEYIPLIEGTDPTEPYLILHGDEPIGYIQTYRIPDHPDYARHARVEDSAAGVDLFIGEKEYLHKGLGSHILRRFLRRIVFANDDIEVCVIGPEPKNIAAIRAYEKAGFRYFRTIQVPEEPEPEYLMKIAREEVLYQ